MKRKRAEPQLSAFAARRKAAAELEAQRVLQSQSSTVDTPSDELSQEDGSDIEVDGNLDVHSNLDITGSSVDNVHQTRSAQVEEAQKAASFSVNVHKSDQGLVLGLKLDTRVAIQGHCNFQVVAGSIDFYGAHLSSGDRQYQLSIPKGESLPVMSTVQSSVVQQDYFSDPVLALVRFTRCDNGLLDALDNYPITKSCFAAANSQRDRDVAVMFSSPEIAGHSVPDSWTKAIATHLTAFQEAELSCTALIGGKGAGKSTLARYLLNGSLTAPHTTGSGGVYYLDLDPGQPEFSVPGTTSLFFFPHHSSPLFSAPPYHTSPHGPVRSHWIGETSPKEDPNHYMACTADLLNTLLQHHRQDSASRSTIIINTPGWIKGTGLDLLQSLQSLLLHHHQEHHFSTTPVLLGSTTDQSLSGTPIDSVRRTVVGPTASDHRTTHLLSYFHRMTSFAQWHPGPVTGTSFTARYGRVPVAVVREVLDPTDLVPAINGTLVALVLMDSDGLAGLERDVTPEGLILLHSHGQVLDPASSRCLGLAIVHGIDLRDRTISLITPVPLDRVTQALSGEEVVLCTGSIEVPIQFMTSGYTEGQERPYVTHQPGHGVGWQSWHVRRNIGRRVRNGQA
ncbi:Polynucleotide 5'-hydroxyl-kinase grc3 [Taphrina deformans PYCC 5710]|uniref:Polynucleotide 5'-hydroxyl-kinase GRC3 n=1 Tax=Taphrina deformans (strain PYCC 5710 / ATCC 11124 / CBS 356.35 / IMI 108563 / JCM 9778 / NBRC 8474) TaxID=1097556 RepID=R4X9V4_TAPDE|nr:Polynucleotide 5'-hydroxyl-kinase grc3 [Taphrina deformans PYCC 5710]|eukprot:CCG82578.1 Polynucleotide 5'-hydroxyl-kinase grc3 [Taphrina deformans PYCC 5710]